MPAHAVKFLEFVFDQINRQTKMCIKLLVGVISMFIQLYYLSIFSLILHSFKKNYLMYLIVHIHTSTYVMNHGCNTQQCITADETYHISRTYLNTTHQTDPKVIVHWTGHLRDQDIFLDSKEVCGKKLSESCILTSNKEYYQVISEFIFHLHFAILYENLKTIASFGSITCNPD